MCSWCSAWNDAKRWIGFAAGHVWRVVKLSNTFGRHAGTAFLWTRQLAFTLCIFCGFLQQVWPRYLHSATSEMCRLSGGREILTKLTLCYTIVYHFNGVQWYEQFLRVVWLDWALILFGLALCLPSTSVSYVMIVLYMYLMYCYILHFTI